MITKEKPEIMEKDEMNELFELLIEAYEQTMASEGVDFLFDDQKTGRVLYLIDKYKK